MMEHNFIYYFNEFRKLLYYFLVFQTQSEDGNLRDSQMRKITPPFTSNTSLSSKIVWCSSRTRLEFKGSCLKQERKAAYTPKNVVIFFIVYELDSWPRNFDTDVFLGGRCFEVLN